MRGVDPCYCLVILGLLVNERRAMPEGGDDGPSFHAYRLVHVDAAGARVGAATHTTTGDTGRLCAHHPHPTS